ncbi:hypothetical protein PRSY57_0305200 [Plasmodium reichenowi]|uniref:Uncharacterized protein n=1 Tax=Plasmodium reichenowi TaxID=5854 RepID=A0A151LTP6_PLARE|nr:hypothetical protein PRSY57_0305200 [Plasmodium reichenowi]KYO02553.1 hypothetical protein PRSY57_0305200 [Plasmodium reichenowi]
MNMNIIYKNKFLNKLTLKNKGMFLKNNMCIFKNDGNYKTNFIYRKKEKDIKKYENNSYSLKKERYNIEYFNDKNNKQRGYMFIQKKLLSSQKKTDNILKGKRSVYIINSFLFICGCLISLYSIFVYDFFFNRFFQICSNVFFLLFHLTKKSVNIVASLFHLLFVCFQVGVLFKKMKD